MQTLFLPAARSGRAPPHSILSSTPISSFPLRLPRPSTLTFSPFSLSSPFSLIPRKALQPLSSLQSTLNRRIIKTLAAGSISTPYSSPDDDTEKAKLVQVSKRLESTSRYFKRLGSLGFWGQLVCTVVAAVILSFSVVITGKITSPATFYATAGGIAAAFISVFWSFGYIRLSDKLRRIANEPSKAPPRADVVRSLKNGIVVNLLGMGAAILGMQATVGLLVAKALTTSATHYQGLTPRSSPVLALDVFLVQASANTILSHFLGLAFSLELLRFRMQLSFQQMSTGDGKGILALYFSSTLKKQDKFLVNKIPVAGWFNTFQKLVIDNLKICTALCKSASYCIFLVDGYNLREKGERLSFVQP